MKFYINSELGAGKSVTTLHKYATDNSEEIETLFAQTYHDDVLRQDLLEYLLLCINLDTTTIEVRPFVCLFVCSFIGQ